MSSTRAGSTSSRCARRRGEPSLRAIPLGRASSRSPLFHARGWGRRGQVSFKWVSRRANTEIVLATPRKVDRLCRPLPTNGQYSCQVGQRMVLNWRRWRKAVPHWTSSRENYRRMLVNHEMGHRLGLRDRSCRRSGAKAAVMQQQSISLQGCRATWWPKRSELRQLP